MGDERLSPTFHTGVVVADVKAILVVVTMGNNTGFEVVAAGWGDCRVGCTSGRGLSNSKGKSGENGRNGADYCTHGTVAGRDRGDKRLSICREILIGQMRFCVVDGRIGDERQHDGGSDHHLYHSFPYFNFFSVEMYAHSPVRPGKLVYSSHM